MSADTSISVLPEFGLVSLNDTRVAGRLEEVEVGGVPFVKVTPHQHQPVLVNAAHIVSIRPCTDDQARIIAANQWGRAS